MRSAFGLLSDRSMQRQHLSGDVGRVGTVRVCRCDHRLRSVEGSAASTACAAAASTTRSACYPDLRGRLGDPGDRGMPGSAAATSPASASA